VGDGKMGYQYMVMDVDGGNIDVTTGHQNMVVVKMGV
jgi:hypothetical protein